MKHAKDFHYLSADAVNHEVRKIANNQLPCPRKLPNSTGLGKIQKAKHCGSDPAPHAHRGSGILVCDEFHLAA
jgi:hypothetical protein